MKEKRILGEAQHVPLLTCVELVLVVLPSSSLAGSRSLPSVHGGFCKGRRWKRWGGAELVLKISRSSRAQRGLGGHTHWVSSSACFEQRGHGLSCLQCVGADQNP